MLLRVPSTVLVTGGAGYIGSHACVELLTAGYDVIVVDNLSNSSSVALDRVAELTGRAVRFEEVDIRDRSALDAVFQSADIDSVVHFAGLKAVGESVAQPLRYYENNVAGTVTLLDVMEQHDVHNLVFSSSATVYGDPQSVPIREDASLQAVNPYGRTKLFIEEILRDHAAASPGWHIVLLRYFNPVGAHPSGRIGEDPAGIPNNLMPFVMQVAVGRLEKINVFGGDYPTPDGTGVRDYIHVVDLAIGHVAALDRIDSVAGCEAINLGTGSGHSVLEVVEAASKAVGRPLPYAIVDRRPGDVAAMFADVSVARERLEWKATRTLEDMVRDHWNWQSSNPNGYR